MDTKDTYILEYGGNLLFLNELLNIIKSLSNPIVLDIGCGLGTLAQFLSAFSRVISTEISKERFLIAREKIPCFYEKEGNIPQNIGSFDLIYCKEVLPSIKNKSLFYKQIYEALSKNGFFCTYMPNVVDIYEKPLFRFIPSSIPFTISSYTSLLNNKRLLREAGFKKIKETRISLGSIHINERYVNKHVDGYFNNSSDEFKNARIEGLKNMISSINYLSQAGINIYYEFERTMIIAQK